MAVKLGPEGIKTFEEWYVDYQVDDKGCLDYRNMAPCAAHFWREFDGFKREMDARVSGYDVLEKIADAEVIKEKPDLPNISSGETSGLVLRIARNVVQNTPNVEVISRFDDDDPNGILAAHVLRTKIIGSDLYSNDMQQNLFASVKTSLTLGFAAVVPVLLRDRDLVADGLREWC